MSLFLALGLILPRLRLENAVSMRTMANATVVFSFVTLVPFLSTMFRLSKSWTGLQLTNEEKKIIVPGHIIGLFVWLAISFVQTLTARRMQWLHNKLGLVGFAVIAYCVFELVTNAVFAFVPTKPMLLARATLGRDPSNWEIVMFTNCFIFALMVPFGSAFHGYHAAKSVLWDKERCVRSHVHHVICMMTWILNPGQLRIIIRAIFYFSGCQPFTSREDTILVQTTSFHISATILAVQHWLMFAILPPKLKKKTGTKFMRWFTIPLILWQLASCYILGVNPWHMCGSPVYADF